MRVSDQNSDHFSLMNNLSIFQNCIYCRGAEGCQNIDCLFYPHANVSPEELDDHSDASRFHLVNELCDKLGITPGVSLYPVYKQLLASNKKTSRNILSLASIYYSANLNFYFPIYNLLRYCENAESACSLHQKFVKIWVKSGLDPPPDNSKYIIDFVLSRNRKLIPPKYSQDISQIMATIKNSLAEMKESNLKLPVLACLGFYFHKHTTCRSDDICDLLQLSKAVVKKNKSFVNSCKQIISNLKSLDVCIDL